MVFITNKLEVFMKKFTRLFRFSYFFMLRNILHLQNWITYMFIFTFVIFTTGLFGVRSELILCFLQLENHCRSFYLHVSHVYYGPVSCHKHLSYLRPFNRYFASTLLFLNIYLLLCRSFDRKRKSRVVSVENSNWFAAMSPDKVNHTENYSLWPNYTPPNSLML